MILVHIESTDIKQKSAVKNKRRSDGSGCGNGIPLSISLNIRWAQFLSIIFTKWRKKTIEREKCFFFHVFASFCVCAFCCVVRRLSVCAQHADENVIDSFFSLSFYFFFVHLCVSYTLYTFSI